MLASTGKEEARIRMGPEMKSDSTARSEMPCPKAIIKVIVVLGSFCLFQL